MKRKLGVALLIVATALAGTPEALKQFHDINQTLQHWTRTSLGGSFLVYAESTGERAGLPDRYDYHQLAPHVAAAPAASSYGLMASLSLPEAAAHAHAPATCPSVAPRRTVERVNNAPRARAVETRTVARTERTLRRTRELRGDQLAREIERAATIAARVLGTKLDAQQFAEIIKGQELDAKLKALRIRPSRETLLKPRRPVPVRVALFTEDALPVVNGFEPAAPLPLAELARRGNEDENRPGATAEEQSKRKGDAKTRKTQKPGARTGEQRDFDVAPFVIMAATDADTKGFGCDGNDDNNN